MLHLCSKKHYFYGDAESAVFFGPSFSMVMLILPRGDDEDLSGNSKSHYSRHLLAHSSSNSQGLGSMYLHICSI